MELNEVFVNVEILRYLATGAALLLFVGIILLLGELGIYRPIMRVVRDRQGEIVVALEDAVGMVDEETDPAVLRIAKTLGLPPQTVIAVAPPVLRALADAFELALKYTEPPAREVRIEPIGVTMGVTDAAAVAEEVAKMTRAVG